MSIITVTPGTKVHYIGGGGRIHNGIIKDLVQRPIITEVFVVYHCDGDWDNYRNYTSARTEITELHPGWKKKVNFGMKWLISKHIRDAHT